MTYTLSTNNQVYMGISTPFAQAVILTKITGFEQISALFEFEMELCSNQSDLNFDSILGQPVCAWLVTEGGLRYFNGIVASFQQESDGTRAQTFYTARVVPALWTLHLSKNCRIFQDLSARQIIQEILSEHNILFDDKIRHAGSETWEYCVQFNESDLAFINRLMEFCGISYFFIHTENTHTLVLIDNNIDCVTINPLQKIPYVGRHHRPLFGFSSCVLTQSLTSTGAARADYNFKTPQMNLFNQTGNGNVTYEYPGGYETLSQGAELTKQRLEAQEFMGIRVVGKSNVAFLCPGYAVGIVQHPRADINANGWIVEEVTHDAKLPEDHDETDVIAYTNTFRFFPQSLAIRPSLSTPWPQLTTQTAIVTGKEGEEIWTDQYGRVKVKFPWDQSSTANDRTTCWIRFSQSWTGNGWGMVFIPRVGQEVVVHFLSGRPETPMITGCVYNQINLPPYLPDEPTKSTIKTNSSKGGGGFNELRFEDKKGAEEVYVHAQKDMLIEVEENQTTLIKKGNQTTTLQQGDETRTLQKGNQTLHIQSGNRDLSIVGGNETHKNAQNFTHTVTGNYDLTVDGNFTLNVTGSVVIKSGTQTVTINGMTGVTIASNASVTVQGTASVEVMGAALTLSGEATADLSGGEMCTITGGMISLN